MSTLRACSIRLFLLALFCLPAERILAQEAPVQLLLPSRTLQPKSTFELRFATEMVAPDQIGKPADPAPLVLQPPVPGRFVWLSNRSGTFAPENALPLATNLLITLRGGLKDAAGRDVPAKLREIAETPPFGVTAIDSSSSDDASMRGRHLALFNANVNAAAAAKFIRYVNAAGSTIAARVEQAEDPNKRDRTFRTSQSDDKSLGIWGEESPPADPSEDEEDNADEAAAATSEKPKLPPRHNVLFIAPVKPLPPGKDWRLVLDAGLPAADAKIALPTRKEIAIGTVKPFAVTAVTPETNRTDGRRLALELSKPLAEDVTPENISRWIKLEPARRS